MSHKEKIEARVAALEREVGKMKRQLDARRRSDWVYRVAGSLEDEPEFDKVLELGRELRQSDRC
jgi:hypothetical protein